MAVPAFPETEGHLLEAVDRERGYMFRITNSRIPAARKADLGTREALVKTCDDILSGRQLCWVQITPEVARAPLLRAERRRCPGTTPSGLRRSN